MSKKAAIACLFIALLVACSGPGRIITPVTTDFGSVKTLTPISSPLPMLEPSPTSACSPIFSPVGFWPDNSHILGLLTVEGQSKTWLQVLELQSLTVQTILEVDQIVNLAALSPDRTILAWAMPDFSVQLVSLAEGKAASPFTGHSDVVNALVFSPNGGRLYTAGRDKTVLVWDLTGQVLQTFQLAGADNLPSEVMGLDISPDGKTLVTIPAEGNARMWAATDFKQIGEYPGIIGGAYNGASVAFSSDGRFLALGLAAGPGSTALWRLADNTQLWSGGFMSNSLFSPDSRFFAHTQHTENNQQQIVIRSADGQTVFQTIEPASADVIWKLLFSPDNAKLVSVSNAQISMWNVTDGKLFESYQPVCP